MEILRTTEVVRLVCASVASQRLQCGWELMEAAAGSLVDADHFDIVREPRAAETARQIEAWHGTLPSSDRA